MPIHPTAIVNKGAEIDSSAEVGPYCIIGPHVKIGPRTKLMSHVVLDNHTLLGSDNVIHPFASLGGRPQDLKFKGEPSRLILGDNNVIRESVTMNIGTEHGRMETRIGSGCLFMAYSHAAHDNLVGDGVIVANGVGLAGHVTIDDRVILGGMAGVHQFCHVGRHAFLAAGAMAAQDVPPFCIAQGDRAQLVGINVIGLKRHNWDREKIQVVRDAFKRLFRGSNIRVLALETVEKEFDDKSPEVNELCEFIRQSKRGVCPPRLILPAGDTYDS